MNMSVKPNTLNESIDSNILSNAIINTTVKEPIWVNNQTRLNEKNMNDLRNRLISYSDATLRSTYTYFAQEINNIITRVPGWLCSKQDNEQKVLTKGAVFNDLDNNTAEHDYSSAFGQGTQTASDGQFVIGKYNAIDADAVFIIGNGEEDTNRSNLFVIDKEGKIKSNKTVEIVGKLSVTKSPTKLTDVVRKKELDALRDEISGALHYIGIVENAPTNNVEVEILSINETDGNVIRTKVTAAPGDIVLTGTVDAEGAIEADGNEYIFDGKNWTYYGAYANYVPTKEYQDDKANILRFAFGTENAFPDDGTVSLQQQISSETANRQTDDKAISNAAFGNNTPPSEIDDNSEDANKHSLQKQLNDETAKRKEFDEKLYGKKIPENDSLTLVGISNTLSDEIKRVTGAEDTRYPNSNEKLREDLTTETEALKTADININKAAFGIENTPEIDDTSEDVLKHSLQKQIETIRDDGLNVAEQDEVDERIYDKLDGFKPTSIAYLESKECIGRNIELEDVYPIQSNDCYIEILPKNILKVSDNETFAELSIPGKYTISADDDSNCEICYVLLGQAVNGLNYIVQEPVYLSEPVTIDSRELNCTKIKFTFDYIDAEGTQHSNAKFAPEGCELQVEFGDKNTTIVSPPMVFDDLYKTSLYIYGNNLLNKVTDSNGNISSLYVYQDGYIKINNKEYNIDNTLGVNYFHSSMTEDNKITVSVLNDNSEKTYNIYTPLLKGDKFTLTFTITGETNTDEFITINSQILYGHTSYCEYKPNNRQKLECVKVNDKYMPVNLYYPYSFITLESDSNYSDSNYVVHIRYNPALSREWTENQLEIISSDLMAAKEITQTNNSTGCLTPNSITGTVAFGVGTLIKSINEGTIHEGVDEDGIEYNIEQVLNDLTNVFKNGTINRLGQSIIYTKQQLAKAWVDMDINSDTNPIFWYFDKQVFDNNDEKITDPPRLNLAYEFGGFNSGTDNLNRMEGGTCSGIANIGITGTATSIEGLNNRVIDARYGHIEGRFNEVTGNFHHVEGSSNYVEGESNHAENSLNVVLGKYNHAESYDGHIISERGHIEGSGSRARVGLIDSFNVVINDTSDEINIIADNYIAQFKSLKVNDILKIGLNYCKVTSVTKPKNDEVTSTSIATVVIDKSITASKGDEVYKVTHFNSGGAGHVEGKDNTNLAHSGHVEGKFNKLFEEAIASHAGGTSNQIWGENSLSTGWFNEVTGKQALSGGTHNKIYADNAAAIGMWNNAKTPNGFACGTYNAQATDVLLAVGNGTAASDRRDAFQVKTDGSAKVQGDITANGVNINTKVTELEGKVKELKEEKLTFSDGETITLKDNTSYVADGEVTSLTITYPDGDFISSIEFTTASEGVINITLPESKYIGEPPTFLNGETWELNIRNGVVVGGLVE